MLGITLAERTKNSQFLPTPPAPLLHRNEGTSFTTALAICIFRCRLRNALMLEARPAKDCER
jgi:hypothetical protein